MQEQIEEIVEVYDEEVHGPLDAPMVRDEVYASRKYYGPPRNETERLAHEADMEALRQFVAQHGDSSSAERAQHAQESRRQEHHVEESTDSDDEDSSTLAPQPSSQKCTGVTAEPQLNEEIDRLAAIFESAGAMDDKR